MAIKIEGGGFCIVMLHFRGPCSLHLQGEMHGAGKWT